MRHVNPFLFLFFLFLFVESTSAQSFDRLLLRPRKALGSTYIPGVMDFAGSSNWPSSNPNTIGLQARLSLEPYGLTWPTAGPSVDSCFLVDPTGQMSYLTKQSSTACKQGRARIQVQNVVLLSQVDGYESIEYARSKFALAGDDMFWLEIWTQTESHLGIWTFSVPPALSSPPKIDIYTYSSSGFGPDAFDVRIRCTTPGDGDLFNVASWDAANSSTISQTGATHIMKKTVTLTNNDDMTAEDLCQVAIERDGVANLMFFMGLVVY